jgi:lycopene elongase/hydratase (dihydrobisanhydrobacterioruberin-forming)
MKIEQLLTISRPHFWIYTLGPFLLGISSSIYTKQWSTELIIMTVCYGLYFLLPANVLIYGVNDIYDYETDKINSKKTGYEEVLDPKNHSHLVKKILWFQLPLVLLSLLNSTNIPLLLSTLSFIFVSVYYSATPIRAKSIPFVDTLFNSIYVLPALIGYFVLHPDTSGFQVSLAFAGLLWSMAMHAYSAIPDIEADSQSNIHTIATKLGFKRTLIFCYVCYALATFISLDYLKSVGLLAFCVYSFLLILTLKGGKKNIFTYYKLFPRVNFIVGMMLFFVIFLRLL